MFKNYFAISLTALLVACGGGGGDTPAGFDASPFVGVWMNDDTPYCGRNAAEDIDGKVYSVIARFTTITKNSGVGTNDLYQGLDCITKVGTFTYSSNLEFSAATIAGKSIAARVSIAAEQVETAQRTDGSTIPLKLKTDGTIVKTVFAVDGGVLYLGDDTGPKDADGYPTTVQRYGPKQ